MDEDLSNMNQPNMKKSRGGFWAIVIILAIILLGIGYLFTLDTSPLDESNNVANEVEQADTSSKEVNEESESENDSGDFIEDGENTDTEPEASEEIMEEEDEAIEEEEMEDEQETKGPETHAVTYSSSGFSPKTVTIKLGDTVTWTNESGSNMWVATAVHPSHTVYDGTSTNEHCSNPNETTFDQCSGGDSYLFTFIKEGNWKYHNHQGPQHTGTVVVE
jgi:plastocyanin